MQLNRFFKIQISNADSTVIYNIDGTTPGVGISAGTMSLEEILCDSKLEIGAVNSNKFEVEIYGLTHDVTGMKIVVTNEPTGELPETIFTGYIESSTTDNKNGYRKIVAYDLMYTVRDTDVAVWWNTFWEGKETATFKQIRESMCAYVGFDLVTTILVNDSYAILKPNSFTNVKFSTLLKMICEIQCCFPNVARDGRLDFVWLDSNATTITNLYDKNKTTFEDYTTAQINAINVYGSSNELSQTVKLNEQITDTNAYNFVGNIFLLSMTAPQITQCLTNVINVLSTVSYRPGTVPMISSDLTMGLGRKLVIVVPNESNYVLYALKCSYSGAQLVEQTITCKSEGEYLSRKVSTLNDTMVIGWKYSSLKQDIDGISADVYDETTGRTKLDIRAEGLQTQITNVDGRTTTVEATIDGLTVTSETGTTLIAGDKIQTENLYIHRIWSYTGSINSFAEMEDAGITYHLGTTGRIFLGYSDTEVTNLRLPFLKLDVDTGDRSQTIPAALLQRYRNGVWLGDDADIGSSTIQGGTGLYIDVVTKKAYKYVNGTPYELADAQTNTAVFG